MPSRLSGLQTPKDFSEFTARAQHPLALTDLANLLLRFMPSYDEPPTASPTPPTSKPEDS